VNGVFLAERAILAHLKTVRVVLLIFHSVVVALLAFAANHSDSDSHIFPPDSIDKGIFAKPRRLCLILSPSRRRQQQKSPLRRGSNILSHLFFFVNTFLKKYLS
jgi:hypothetical protein